MIYRYKHGCILPSRHSQGDKLAVYSFDGGVTDSEGRFVELSMLHEKPCDVGGAYKTEMKESSSTVIYIGYLFNAWGHCLTDNMKKLWFLRTEEARRLLSNGARIAFVTLYNKPLPKHQAELWRLAGFDCSDWLLVNEATRFEEVIIPENSFVTYPDESRIYDERFKEIIRTIKSNAIKEADKSTETTRKIYFTRTKLKGHKDFNERQIERLFQRLGYEIIPPERLSVVEQISLWANAAEIATTEGSIAHSSMFMRSDGKLTILRKADYVNGYQQAAERLSGVKATYINANHSTRTPKDMPWAGPFFLCITQELERWSGLKVHQLPVQLKPSYWNYCINDIYNKVKQNLYVSLYKYKTKWSHTKEA